MPPAPLLEDAAARALLEGKVEDLARERDELKARLDLVQRLERRIVKLESVLRLLQPFVKGAASLRLIERTLGEPR